MDNDEDNSIRHYQLDDEVVNFFPRVPGDTTAADTATSLFKRGHHGMCRVLTLASLVLIVVVMIMGGVVGVRKRRLRGRRQRRRQRRQGCIKRRGQCGRREEEEFIRGGDDDHEEEKEFAKKCFVYNQNFEKRNWNFDVLERGLGVVREEEEEKGEEEDEEVAGENGNQNQNGRPLILHDHHHVSLKAPVIVDLEDV